jgi:hypothetical protein
VLQRNAIDSPYKPVCQPAYVLRPRSASPEPIGETESEGIFGGLVALSE